MFELGWLEETNLRRCNADQTNENILPEYREFVKLHNIKFCSPCHGLRDMMDDFYCAHNFKC